MKNFIKSKTLYLATMITTVFLLYVPKLAYADENPREAAKSKLKTDFSDAVNGFTSVFQFLAYTVAVLAMIVSGLGALLIHDEQTIKQTKKICTYIIVIAIVIGVASTIITLATNKTV